MARLIGADTSTKATGVAIYETERPLHCAIVEQDRLRAEELLSVMDALCKKSGCRAAEADVYVVAIGPGSFTGLRIGVTMLKTMAQFTLRPIIGISTLLALAEEGCAQQEAQYYVPIIDARANRIFAAAYCQKGEAMECLIEEGLYTEEALLERLNALPIEKDKPAFCWAGIGLDRHPALSAAFPSVAQRKLTGDAALSPIAAVMRLAAKRWERGDSDDVLDLAPHYLRKSQAELDRLRAKHEGRPS